MECPICLNPQAVVRQHQTRDALVVQCAQCENFTISGSAEQDMVAREAGQGWKVSAWLVENKPEVLTTADIETALESARPSLTTRAERMLRWLNAKFPPGQPFYVCCLGRVMPGSPYMRTMGNLDHISIALYPLVPAGWNKDIEEMVFMVKQVLCKELGLLVNPAGDEYQISPKGLLHLEGRRNENSTIGFCAMWFNDKVAPLWTDVIEPAIREAGYQPLRIDEKPHNNRIEDEIIATIRGARFVVADLTGNRGGVYYEAGFAHGLGLDVIFMCRKGVRRHFDIEHYNTLFWKVDALEDAQARLKNRILATLGQGAFKNVKKAQNRLFKHLTKFCQTSTCANSS